MRGVTESRHRLIHNVRAGSNLCDGYHADDTRVSFKVRRWVDGMLIVPWEIAPAKDISGQCRSIHECTDVETHAYSVSQSIPLFQIHTHHARRRVRERAGADLSI